MLHKSKMYALGHMYERKQKVCNKINNDNINYNDYDNKVLF